MPRATKIVKAGVVEGAKAPDKDDFHLSAVSEYKPVKVKDTRIEVTQKNLEDRIPPMERMNPENLAVTAQTAKTASDELKKVMGAGHRPQLVDSSPQSQLANRNVFYVR